MYIYEVVGSDWQASRTLWVCATEEIAQYLLDWENASTYNTYLNWLASPECAEDREAMLEHEGTHSYQVWSHYEQAYKIIKTSVITSTGAISE